MSDRTVSKLLERLIDAGFEMPSDLQGDIALCPAATEFLLQHGANPNSTNQNAPMFRLGMSGISYDPARLYAVLRQYKARVDITNEYGNTPLHYLCSWAGYPELVHAMIRDGADVNARNHDGQTPLHWAEDKAIAQALLDAGADPNIKDNAGKTVLQLAKEKKLGDDVIKLLQEHGAKEE